jgi:hypothetical protein
LTSGSSRPRLAALAAAGLALLLPPGAGAVDVKLWPLFRYAHDEKTDEMRWSALGPLIEFTRTAEMRDLRIRPLLWLQQRRGAGHDDRADILYPLASTRWTDDYQSLRFLLFTFRTAPVDGRGADRAPPPAERWASRFTLFPLVFYRHHPEQGTHLSVLPFWLDLDDFLGYEHVRAVMFPAYLRLTEPRVERRFYGFPFVSTVGGADGRGVRVWPIWGDKEIVGRERTRYVLWPFHIRSERLVPGYGWESQRIDFPVYAAVDGPARQHRAWGVVAHTHTIDWRERTEVTGAPWPFTVRARFIGDEEYFTWRLAPFYGRSDRDGISSRFYAWPVYRRKFQDVDAFHYRRQDVFAVLWRRQTVANDVSGRWERLETVFPALRAEEAGDRDFGQVPAVFDSLLPRNRGVLAMWAPLYGALRWDTGLERRLDWNVLWGLVAREDGRWLPPWYVDLGGPDEAVDGG